jgi:serine phosphatase RsbU (regulator of sigma subunit)/catechol 2,3-dioxygenase-like lactoylglutathione lyase family enzyme
MSNSASSPSPDQSINRLVQPQLHLSLHHVTILVRDQDRSVRFYLDQLGFNLVVDARMESGDRWVAVAPPDGTAILALVTPKSDSDEYKFIGRSTDIVFVTEDVNAKFHQWRERGVRFDHPPHTPSWGGTYTRFEDPDGNSFALAGRDEVSRQIEAQRRVIADQLEVERRTAQELEIAKQVQARLFPQTLPVLHTLDYAGICIPAREVGGDYYDFLKLGPQQLGLVIGDISGKGIAAALLMAHLHANLRSQCAIAWDQLQLLLRSVNQVFFENTTDSVYATLFFAEYDDKARRLRYANCGHLSAILLRGDNTLERLDSTGTVLGLFSEWDCSIAEREILSGDTLALYTDGITESFNNAGDEFGEQRLIEALRRNRDLSSEGLLASIVEEVQRFSPHEQHDDITLIVAKCKEDQ